MINDHESFSKVDDEVEVKINNIKKCINTIHKNFKTLRDGTLELAKKLDEDKICKRDEICNKIKEYVKEEIQNGKITARWIEQSLPKEYKRKYENKSEVSSLSEKQNLKDKEIVMTVDGNSVKEKLNNNLTISDSKIELNNNSSDELKEEDLSTSSIIENGCLICESVQEENRELKEALRSCSLQTADKETPIEFKIPKNRYDEIKRELHRCKEYVIVQCHGYDKIVSIKADILRENNPQQSNSSISTDQYNNNDTSNDDYTY